MDDITARTVRGIGWLLFIGGILIAAGIGIVAFIFDSSLGLLEKLVIGAI